MKLRDIRLNKDANKKDINKYLTDIVEYVKAYEFSEIENHISKNVGYEDGMYYTKTRKREHLTGTQAYYLMKILITNPYQFY